MLQFHNSSGIEQLLIQSKELLIPNFNLVGHVLYFFHHMPIFFNKKKTCLHRQNKMEKFWDVLVTGTAHNSHLA